MDQVSEKNVGRGRLAGVLTFAMLVSVWVVSGCVVKPKPATQAEVINRVNEDTGKMYLNQEPISGPVTMEEAVARALKYNLDYRLKKMESALALSLSDYSNYDMLPQLLATAGYRGRSNYSGGTSISIATGQETLSASTSEERSHLLGGADFSWNILDFGVSYYRARQQANQFLIAEERRRKVVQNLLQDVRAAYWRALGAQRLEAEAKNVLERASQALASSREAEVQHIIPPALALNYQRALLDATSMLNQRRQDLAFAKSELAALMNVPPGEDFKVAETKEASLPPVPGDVRKYEEMALLQRPELREEDYKKRITAEETRKQILGLLPSLSLDLSGRGDTNRLLYYQNWFQAGVSTAWNLMRLVAYPALKEAREDQVKTDEARRMALSMAILTQLRISLERYRLAMEDFKLADTASQVDKRLANYTRASVSARLDSELEAVRTEARAVLGAYQRANAYANSQIAFARLYNTLGFDPLPDNFEGDDLFTLTDRVRQHLRSTERGSFTMTSNLFGHPAAVMLRLEGVEDPAMAGRMKEQITSLLVRNDVKVDNNKGMPVTFALQRNTRHGLEKINWEIELADAKGRVCHNANYATTVPGQARGSAYEAALVAAATQAMPQMRSRLLSMAKDRN